MHSLTHPKMNLIATFGSRDACTCKSACVDAMARGNLSRVLGVSPAGEAPNASNVATRTRCGSMSTGAVKSNLSCSKDHAFSIALRSGEHAGYRATVLKPAAVSAFKLRSCRRNRSKSFTSGMIFFAFLGNIFFLPRGKMLLNHLVIKGTCHVD